MVPAEKTERCKSTGKRKKMAEELQSLLEKIQSDGIARAEAERDAVVAKAGKEAQEIVARAKQEAEAILAAAAAEAQSIQKRAESTIRQAARDIVLKLKIELESRLERAVSGSVKAAVTPQFMAEIIRDMAKQFAADPEAKISILASGRDADTLEQIIRDTLTASCQNMPVVFADSGVKNGMQISFDGGRVYFDFSADAITALIGEYTGGKLACILEDRAE